MNRAFDVIIPLDGLYGFLLVLARITGLFFFLPFPGFRQAPAGPRIVASLALTVAMGPYWAQMAAPAGAGEYALGRTAAWLAAETAFGAGMGLMISLMIEPFLMAGQILGLQAGYSFASTIDPNSEADSSVLIVITQLMAWLLFLSLGFDRHWLRGLGQSFETFPAGHFPVGQLQLNAVLHAGNRLFASALSMALPVVALLLMLDLAFAMLGKINSQLQLLTLMFPVKMLAALALLALVAGAFPRLFEHLALTALESMRVWSGRFG